MVSISESISAVVAANIATIFLIVAIGAQLLILVGAVPVTIAWGGRSKELTPRLRVGGLFAIVFLSLFIYIIQVRAGNIGNSEVPQVVVASSWLITGLMTLNTVGNFASISRIERWLFGPITLFTAIACLVVSIS